MAGKLNGPAEVPSTPRYSSELARGRLFSAADIPAIAAKAPWPLLNQYSADVLAYRLHESFELSTEWDRLDELTPARADLRDFYDGIADKAQQLLWALGKLVDCHGEPLGRLAPGIRHLLSAAYVPEPPHFSGILHRALPEFVRGDPIAEARSRCEEFLAASEAPPPDKPIELREHQKILWRDLGRWEDITTAHAIVAALPEFLLVVKKVADQGSNEMNSRTAMPGNNRDRFQPNLFGHLAGVHFDMFNKPPRTRDNTSERAGKDDGSLPWLTLILSLASERIIACLRPNDGSEPTSDHPVAAAIHKVANLAAATKSDRLAAGWKLWRQRRLEPVAPPVRSGKPPQ